jgi:hypothetical protein
MVGESHFIQQWISRRSLASQIPQPTATGINAATAGLVGASKMALRSSHYPIRQRRKKEKGNAQAASSEQNSV